MSIEVCQLCVKRAVKKGINLCGDCEHTVSHMPLSLHQAETYVSVPFQKLHRVSNPRRSRRQSRRQMRGK
jgi:hypothetical protein